MTPTPETLSTLKRLLAEATPESTWPHDRALELAAVNALPELIEAAEVCDRLKGEEQLRAIFGTTDDELRRVESNLHASYSEADRLRAELAEVRVAGARVLEQYRLTSVALDEARAELARVREGVEKAMVSIGPPLPSSDPTAPQVVAWRALKGVVEER